MLALPMYLPFHYRGLLIQSEYNGTTEDRPSSPKPEPDIATVISIEYSKREMKTYLRYFPLLDASGYPRATAPSDAQKRPALNIAQLRIE